MQGSITEVTGAMAHQVYQRNENDLADIVVGGKYAGEGIVEVRLTGADWQPAECSEGTFSAAVKDVRVGGPYALEIRLTGESGKALARKHIPGLLVGDIWILGGQSNMDGYGKSTNLEPPSRMVHSFEYDEQWHIAKDPICWLTESIDPVHWQVPEDERETYIRWYRKTREAGAGLGVRFGKDLYKATGVPVGLVVSSHSGTTLGEWDPELKSVGGSSLYGSMFRRVQAVGGKVAGVLWFQGESDAFDIVGVGYRDDFRRLIEGFRADFNCPTLPFIYVQIGPYLWADPYLREGWNSVQVQQFAIESEMPNLAMVAAIGSTLSDHIHIDAISQRRLGAQMALMARRLRFGETDIRPGPRPSRVEFIGSDRRRLRVSFTGINGKLSPSSGIMGFSVEKDDSRIHIERSVCDGESVVLELAEPAPGGAVLWHGRGINPTCCLRDSLGLRVPVFAAGVEG